MGARTSSLLESFFPEPPSMTRITRLPSLPFLVLGIVVGMLLPSAAAASDRGGWKSLGPLGTRGSVSAVVIDPGTGTLYVAGYNGVSKSTDGGARWSDVSSGLTDLSVQSLLLDPIHPSTLYAGTGSGIFKSLDGASTWVRLAAGPSDVQAVAMAPLTPSTLFAGTNGEGLFKTTDGGTSWTAVAGLNIRTFYSIAIDPRASGTIYVGGQTLYSSTTDLAKSTDGGATWKTLDPGPQSSYVQIIAISPSSPSTLYVAGYGGTFGALSLRRSTDAGASWLSITDALPPFTQPSLIAVDPRSPLTVYLAAGRALFRSTNGGLTWVPVTSGLTPVDYGSSSDLSALSFDPRSPDVLYVGTVDNGLFRTRDGGATWNRLSRIFSNLTIVSIATDPSNPLTIYAAAHPPDIYKSVDGGVSWAEQTTGIPPSATDLNEVVIDPAAPSTLYVTTSGAGVLKSSDAGATWTSANSGLGLADGDSVYPLAIDPTSHQTLYVQTGTGLFRSADGAATWTRVNPPPGYVGRIAIAPTTPSTLYMGGFDSLFRSVDGGQSWTPLTTGLTGLVTDIVADPQSPLTVYVSGRTPYYPPPQFFPPTENGVARTTDGGESWKRLNSGLATAEVDFLALDPQQPAHLFASTGLGVFASTNAGIGWFLINDEPGAGNYWSISGVLAVDRAQPPNLYVGTPGAGVFRRSAQVASPPCVADSETLCLQGGRFRVRASWSASLAPYQGSGRTFLLTPDTGAFWFFTPNNLELVVKVVDGRSANGHIWVFAGALSDVAYTIVVTDTVTSMVRTYSNPAGKVASIGDTTAF